jgi:Zn-dependent peptidase ImmA (M78 family)/DNA-binding XRE family transcriptional regulator
MQRTAMLNPSRVALARRRRGLTILALASKSGLDRKSIYKCENSKSDPSEETITKLQQALGFPAEFFFGDDIDEPTLESGSFRSMSKMTASQRDMALSQAAFGIHLNDWMAKKFTLPAHQIPDRSREPDPEAAAESIRREWALGNLSIKNMIHLLEAKGVRVFSLAVDAREVDAFSTWRGTTPFVFLNTGKTAEHSRFDAAHELGHLVLHKHGQPNGIEAERQANAFASAFLMPRASVLANAPRYPTYATLVNLKQRWITSVAAVAYRLHELALMSEWQYRGICIEIAKRGKDVEPNSAPREISLILPKVFESLYKDGRITRAQVAKELTLPLSELEQLLFGLTITGTVGGGSQTLGKSPAALSRVK